MTRLSVLLVLALLASGLLLVRSSYESRRLFTALDREQQRQRWLEGEQQRLEAERQAAATHLRVEKMARERLSMRPASPAVTQYVPDGAAPAGAGAER